MSQVQAELNAYFEGRLQEFTLPLQTSGTAFQEAVWRVLLTIPYGQTCSYADVAHKIGQPSAVRAVGHANGDNRISILVPCHRVIGSDGKLTGYGGGLWRKKYLLALEQSQVFSLS
jgi:O-6-methylguanine DNA methyltransferase